MIRLLISLVLLAGLSPAQTTYNAHVKSDCTGDDGDACYTSLSGAIAGELAIGADLTAAGRNIVLKITCYNFQDTTAANEDGFTTDSSHDVWITSDSPATGLWSTSRYRLVVADANALTISDNHVRLEGLQIQVNSTTTNGNPINCVNAFASGAVLQVSNTIVRGNNSATRVQIGISTSAANTNLRLIVWNTIVYGIGSATSSRALVAAGGGGSQIYSTTLIGGYYGLRTVGTVTAKNVYAGGSSNGDYSISSGTLTQTTCASSDASADGTELDSIAVDASTFTNVSSGSEDFRLPSGSPLINVGTDTSGDAAPLNFTNDITGATRPGTWDVGADEYIGAGARKRIIIIQ